MTNILHAGANGRFTGADLQTALDILNRGGCVAFPTDTVYGLGARPQFQESVTRLYEIKRRESAKAIAILVAKPEDVNKIAEGVSEAARVWMNAFWPGPLTIVLPLKSGLPDMLSTNRTIGLRMPDHAAALQLLRLSGPLAVTSANLSGAASATSGEEVINQLEGRIDLLLDSGRTPGGLSSTVVDCTQTGINILREGPIDAAQLQKALENAES